MSSLPPRVHLVSLLGSRGDAAFGWRLLGGNNRELGRGSTALASVEEVVRLIASMQQQAALVAVQHRRGASVDGWTWLASWSGLELAHAARAFRRERESRYNADAFVEALPLAEVRTPSREDRLPLAHASSFLPNLPPHTRMEAASR